MDPMKTKSRADFVNLNAINCAVMVVPMLAPKMTGRADVRVMIPALRKPMSRTDVALELCMMEVTATPTSADLTLLEVIFSRRFLSRPSESVFSESLRR